ncbi:hypothetical protein JI435_412890 [Parastagonospora nodorum SN15]|uniref:Uncharacterized protein n=1 Tax=Phaeosphaeria nodorum (strain SN15 / ATCC MYA-4574 / FGSC 10173) TaxID=321614 RepID=A0A7U2F596_PHANO|nr:hypothetical protein JI435_412890 [Parastagonospora nodorum SN15]
MIPALGTTSSTSKPILQEAPGSNPGQAPSFFFALLCLTSLQVVQETRARRG